MDDKPVFAIGAAGLDPRDLRLIQIVFRHSRYNKYDYRLVEDAFAEPVDILIVNPVDPVGPRAVAEVRRSGRAVPVIAALPRGATVAARHAISIERLTLQLLPILNRVVELDLQASGQAAGAAASPSAPGPLSNAASAPAPRASGSDVTGAAARAATPASAPTTARPARPPVAGTAAASTVAACAPAGAAPAIRAAPTPASGAQRGAVQPGAVPQRAAPSGAASEHDAPRIAAPDASNPGARTAGPGEPSREVRPPALPTLRQPPRPSVASAAVPASAPPPADPAASAQRSNLLPFPVQNPGEGLIAQRLKVLVVDDSPTVRRQLSVAFDRLGLDCEPVASASDALDRLAGQHFDLALVDVVMPEMDGYRLTREIKRNRHLKQMPVIILTSRSSPFDLARGALAGCDTFLTKPVPFRALEAAVVRLLRKSLAIDDLTGLVRTSADLARGPAAATPAPGAPPASPLARLESRVARLFKR